MEFLADGSLKNRNSAGEDKGDGTWSLADGTILYEDTRGPQQWRVVSFDGDRLQVDHQGAQMFFSR